MRHDVFALRGSRLIPRLLRCSRCSVPLLSYSADAIIREYSNDVYEGGWLTPRLLFYVNTAKDVYASGSRTPRLLFYVNTAKDAYVAQ